MSTTDRIIPDDDDLPDIAFSSPTASPYGDSVGRGADYASTSSLVMSRASDIHPEPIRWLWPQRIAIGKQTLLAGEPAAGVQTVLV